MEQSWIEEIAAEAQRVNTSCDCGGDCPSLSLCREKVARLTGWQQTKAVRAWMEAALCVCPFVVPNRDRQSVLSGAIGGPLGGSCDAGVHPNTITDRMYSKAGGNWRAERRRKLIQCPGCKTYFDNGTVRDMGLYSEWEWRRKGYEFLDKSSSYTLDPRIAWWTNPYMTWKPERAPENEYGEKEVRLTHRRRGPRPVARIWRPFFDRVRFRQGLWLIDLFHIDQMDRWHETIFTPTQWREVLAERARLGNPNNIRDIKDTDMARKIEHEAAMRKARLLHPEEWARADAAEQLKAAEEERATAERRATEFLEGKSQ